MIINAHQRGVRRTLTALAAATGIVFASAATTAAADGHAPSGVDLPDDCEADEGRISIATGNSTGVYYVLGGGIASLISDETPMKATAAETGASVQNIEQLVNGDFDVAFSLADTAADAVNGTASFDEPQPVQALGRIHSNYTQVVVRNEAGIESIEDMAGKAISTGSPGSGTEVIAGRLLEAAGLSIDDDVEAQRLELGQTVEGMKDGSIDGFFWSGGLPTGALTDLFSTNADDVTFLDVTGLLPAMQEINPVYAEGSIPADTYGTDEDIATIVVPNVLLVTDEFAENNACALTYLIWSNVEALADVHPAALELDPSVAADTGPIPIAPGAQRALEALGGATPTGDSTPSST